jgi:hypothetical protein
MLVIVLKYVLLFTLIKSVDNIKLYSHLFVLTVVKHVVGILVTLEAVTVFPTIIPRN